VSQRIFRERRGQVLGLVEDAWCGLLGTKRIRAEFGSVHSTEKKKDHSQYKQYSQRKRQKLYFYDEPKSCLFVEIFFELSRHVRQGPLVNLG